MKKYSSKIIKNLKPLDFGRKSEIFAIDANYILKLYDQNFPKIKVFNEFDYSKIVASQTYLEIPKPIKPVKLQKRTGIIYERIYGISIMNMMMQMPWKINWYLSTISSLHLEVHKYKDLPIPNQTSIFAPIIRRSDRLNNQEKNMLLSILFETNSNNLCHGDFHQGNLMIKPDGKIVILDWMDAFSGNPLLDVALTAVNAMISTTPEHIPIFFDKLYEIVKRIMPLDKNYLRRYGCNKNINLQKIILLAAGIHLVRAENSDVKSHLYYFHKVLEKIKP